MLASLAAAGFSVALEAVVWAGFQNIEADPFRILQAVVSGMALLAAGTIIKGDGQVTGVTTGAIGVAVGAGMYAVSVFIATLSFAILYGLRKRPQQPVGRAPTRRRRRKTAQGVRIVIAGWGVFGLGLGLMLSVSCHADGAAIAKTGAGAAPACQTCHGPAGEGNAQAGFPRLASLGATYMQRQLAAFADGMRVSDVMMPIAKALSVADRAEVSAYYAALPAPAAALPNSSASAIAEAPASASVGATLATRGRWADKLPACEQCHGPGGRGVGPDFPALAGQSATYLANQLTAWKSGARPPGPMGLMAVVANKLSEAEVRAVADHYAAQPAKGER